MNSVCVFCGSSPGRAPEYAAAAAELGAEMARRELTLVFGGGRVGLMGIVADAVLQGGGKAIGVMPEHLVRREIAHTGLTELHVVETMHERKQLMADLAGAFVMLPGGFGTWDEFCEVVTWSQLGLHANPLGILNVAGYYDALLTMMGRAVDEGFVRAAHHDTIVVERSAVALLDALVTSAADGRGGRHPSRASLPSSSSQPRSRRTEHTDPR